jgi:hypothetical protein
MATGDVVFQVFHLNVAYVTMTIYACCKRMFNVTSICFKCFKCVGCMFQVFYLNIVKVYLDIVYHACCKRMF